MSAHTFMTRRQLDLMPLVPEAAPGPKSDIAGRVVDLPKLHIARTWLAYAFRELLLQ
jgi:hypothetical protein